MAADQLQLQRFELKYRIREEVALAVRHFVRAYLVLDEHAAIQPNYSYPIHSVYLDSEELALYWNTLNGDKNRFKLRLRYYDGQPMSPVFFEIKRRSNEAILKERGAVRACAVGRLLSGHFPERPDLAFDGPGGLLAVQRFSQLMQQLKAAPKARITYVREAWISAENNHVRITMDRHVEFEPDQTGRLTTELIKPAAVFGDEVILELKFTGRFPGWFREMTRIFGLRQGSAAKYADGVALVGEDRVKFPPAYARFAQGTVGRENSRPARAALAGNGALPFDIPSGITQ